MDFMIIHLSHMRNDQHFQYGGEFGSLVSYSDPKELKIEALFEEWQQNFNVENESLKKINKSAITNDIAEADAVRDHTFRGLVDTQKGLLNHFSPDKKKAAAQLQIVFDTYGNIAHRPLVEKTGVYANFLEEMRSEQYEETVNTAGFAEWFDELGRNNAEVARLISLRDDESAGRSGVALKKARALTDASYNAIIKRIGALLEVEGEADPERKEVYEQFIRRLNAIIERHNAGMAARRGRSSAEKNGIDAA